MKFTTFLRKSLQIFRDDNSWNEKSIIGFIAFLVMIAVMAADLITSYIGHTLAIKEYIYNSFVVLVLGSFGIAGIEKIFVKKSGTDDKE